MPGERDSALIQLDAVAESTSELRSLRTYLQNYADQIDPVTRSDRGLLTAADVLRRLMEAVYQQSITFDREERPAGNDDVEWHDRLDLARTDARAFMDNEAKAKTSSLPAEAKSWDVQNLTDDAIELTGRGQPTFVVPAFGSRNVDREPRTMFDNVDGLVARNELGVKANITRPQTALLIVLGLEFWVVPLFVVAALIWGDGSWWLIGPAVLVAMPVLVVVFGEDTLVREFAWGALKNAPRSAMNLSSLLLVLFFAVVVPAVTIFLGADLHDVVERARTRSVTDGGPDDLTLLARGMQLLFIAAASMLPGLLYFQFDREHLRTIEQKFTRQVFRLDPRVRTEPALLAKYVIVLDWIVTLLNPQIGTISDQTDLVSLFQPHQSAGWLSFSAATWRWAFPVTS